jgi:hypothetical protein
LRPAPPSGEGASARRLFPPSLLEAEPLEELELPLSLSLEDEESDDDEEEEEEEPDDEEEEVESESLPLLLSLEEDDKSPTAAGFAADAEPPAISAAPESESESSCAALPFKYAAVLLLPPAAGLVMMSLGSRSDEGDWALLVTAREPEMFERPAFFDGLKHSGDESCEASHSASSSSIGRRAASGCTRARRSK